MRFVGKVLPLGALVLAVGALSSFSSSSLAARRPAPSINNLKGTYTGPYTSTNGGENGQLILKITKDKLDRSGVRLMKGTAKFGRKTYKLQAGGFEPATRQMNLAGITGRPPNITQISIVGFFNESGTTFTGGYQIISPGNAILGETTVSR